MVCMALKYLGGSILLQVRLATTLWRMSDRPPEPFRPRLTDGSGSAGPAPVNLFEVGSMIVRRWRLVVGLPLLTGAILAFGSYLIQPLYTASAAFYPESKTASRIPAALAGLGAQFGFSLGGEASRSPRFFADVVTSREIVEDVLLTRFPRPGAPADTATLLAILEIERDTPEATLEEGVRRLTRMVSVVLNAQTNIIRLSVTTVDPRLSAAVGNRFIQLVDAFNRETLQSQARQRRAFTERRRDEARVELSETEEALRTFLERNRRWEMSPLSQFEHGRLQRQVQLRQEVYLTLARETETARIDEANDVSAITIVEQAVPPTRRSSPRRRPMGYAGFAIGVVLALGIAVGGEYLRRLRQQQNQPFQEFTKELGRAREEVGRALLRRKAQ
jgi:uncharacterized protein involved in exopolysaccharide biosynthesis